MHAHLMQLAEQSQAQTREALKLVEQALATGKTRGKYELLDALITDVNEMPTFQVYGENLVRGEDLLKILDFYVKKL